MRDGVARRASDGVLAGSVTTMIEGIRQLHALGAPLAEAVAAATSVPARVAGRGAGGLRSGAAADVLILDDRWSYAPSSSAGRSSSALAEIVLERVTKVFGGGVVAVDDISLRIEDGEFIVLVGPSGCGKSTLLRLIAGLEEATGGSSASATATSPTCAPRERDVAMVFQSYALYPHMSVRQNLGYGLKVRRTEKADAARRVERGRAAAPPRRLARSPPAELSGGQRQRVAMGRAVIREPQAFLMDEPLSNLDAKLRVSMRPSSQRCTPGSARRRSTSRMTRSRR